MADIFGENAPKGARRWAPSHRYEDARDADEINPKVGMPEPSYDTVTKAGERKAPAGSIEEKVLKGVEAKRGAPPPAELLKNRPGGKL